MKKLFLVLVFAFVDLPLRAVTPSPFIEGVGFSAIFNGFGGGLTMTVNGENGGGSVAVNVNAGESTVATAGLSPSKQYTFSVNGAIVGNYNNSTHEYTYSGNYTTNFTAPKGYSIYINGVLTDGWSQTYSTMSYSPTIPINDNYTLELRPLAEASRADAGSLSGIDIGKAITWEVGLGGLRTGRSAGRIIFKQLDLTNSPATRDRLYYAVPANNGQIQVVYDGASNNRLLQVGTPQTVLILSDNAGGGYTFNFYNTTDATWSTSTNSYSPNSGALPWRTIQVSAPTGSSLRLTETNNTSSPAVVRVSLLTLVSGTVSSGTYVWQLQEGDGITWLRLTNHSSVPVGGSNPAARDDTVTVSDSTGVQKASVTDYHYVTQPWGEEITQIVVSTGTSSPALSTSYVYNINNATPGNYRQIQSVTDPKQNWTSFLYYDDWNRRGQVAIESHPFLSSPSTVQAAAISVGSSIAYDYLADYSGRYRNESSRKYYISNVQTGQRTTVPTLVTASSYTNLQINDYASATSSIQSTSQISFPIGSNPDLYNQTLLAQRPDTTQDSMGYYLGNYSGGTFTVSNSGVLYFRTNVWHGTSNPSGGDSFSSYGGQGVPNIYLVPNISTMDVTIQNPAGLVVHKETQVYTGGGNFTLLATEDFLYDGAGRLTDVTPSNGASIHNTYTNGQLVSTVDGSGIESDFTYDKLGRILTNIKKGAPASGSFAAQSDITTTFTYDPVSRVIQTQISGGGQTLTTNESYDWSGRRISETKFADNVAYSQVTSYQYSTDNKTETITLPGPAGATRIETVFADGKIAAITGTGVVNEVFTYLAPGSNGNLSTQHQFSSGASPTTTTVTYDWLGRQITYVQPALSSGTATTSWTYDGTKGQLTKCSQTGYADTLYMYDVMGRLYRAGLDINANGALDLQSTDRIVESDVSYYNEGGGWFLHTHNLVYANPNSNVSTVVSDEYDQVSGFSGTIQAETQNYDCYGNLSQATISINRSAKIATKDRNIVGSSTHEITNFYNGLLVSSQDSANVTMAYGYDSLGRPVQQIDPRTGITTAAYIAGTSLLYSITDPSAVAQATYNYDSAGRITTFTNALGKVARYEYTALGQVFHEWGDTTFPIEHSYDSYGRQVFLKTYAGSSSTFSGSSATSWPSAPGTPAFTFWNYDEATGLLKNKYDAVNLNSSGAPTGNPTPGSVAYTYTAAGQVLSRINQRGTTTNYTYSPTTGELTNVTYLDSGVTPAVTYSYNRYGGLSQVIDAAGTRTFNYNVTGTLELQSESLPAFFNNRILTLTYDTSTIKGRSTGFQLGSSVTPSADQNVTYGYQSDGRLSTLAAAGQTFIYSYLANSHLVNSVGNSAYQYTDSRTYSATHDWTVSRTSTTTLSGSLATPSSFVYTQDVMGRYLNVAKTGGIFSIYGNGSDTLTTNYAYDDVSEITGEQTVVNSTSSLLPGRNNGSSSNPGFNYDKLGNRLSTQHNGNISSYAVNADNEYTTRSVAGIFDVTGAAATGATVTVNGSNANVARSGQYYFDPISFNNATVDIYSILSVSDGTTTSPLPAFLPGQSASQRPTYDADGNLSFDGRWNYTYDAENRLIQLQTSSVAVSAGTPNQKVSCSYDYRNRRIRKVVSNWNGSAWVVQDDRQFIYYGDKLIAEVNSSNFTVIKSYYWGLDLSGSGQGAGGVGGLLMMQGSFYNASTSTTDTATLLPLYDALGNMCGLMNSQGTVMAVYEYDAFGQTLRESGPYGASNSIGFSTKYTDLESGLIYYGLRYYNSSFGRFINRDPIEESGGVNLYGFCGNNAANSFDILGMSQTVSETFYTYLSNTWVPATPSSPTNYDGSVTFTVTFSDQYAGVGGGRILSSSISLTEVGKNYAGQFSISLIAPGVVDLIVPGGKGYILNEPASSWGLPITQPVNTPVIPQPINPVTPGSSGIANGAQTITGPLTFVDTNQYQQSGGGLDGVPAISAILFTNRTTVSGTDAEFRSGSNVPDLLLGAFEKLRYWESLMGSDDVGIARRMDHWRKPTISDPDPGLDYRFLNPYEKGARWMSVSAMLASTFVSAPEDAFLAAESGFIPRGFANAEQFSQASAELRTALANSGITDAQIGVRGSSITGFSARTGAPFSAASDIDFFVESGQLTEGFSTSRNIPGFVHPDKLLGSFPELEAWSSRWTTTLGRDVTPGAFTPGSLSGTPMPQPFLWIK